MIKIKNEEHRKSLIRLRNALNGIPNNDWIDDYIIETSKSIKSQAETYKLIIKEARYKGFWYELTDFLGLR